ncbi:MAG: hypothetical protein KGY54_09065 [Oleiphilaceae bacterium]|nr:hypothetical protein [Oleiphilaceae bacterium]
MARALFTPLLTLGVVLTLLMWLVLKNLVAQELPITPLPADLTPVSCHWPPAPLLSTLD